jgi:hypothetical protein
MSPLGQKPTYVQKGMSALPPENGHWPATPDRPLSANSGHFAGEFNHAPKNF